MKKKIIGLLILGLILSIGVTVLFYLFEVKNPTDYLRAMLQMKCEMYI